MAGDGDNHGVPALEEVHVDKKRAALAAVLAIALAGAAFAAVGSIASYGEVAKAFSRARTDWFALVPAGLAANYAGYALAFRAIARAERGPVLGWWAVTRVVFLRSGAAIVVAGGALAVDAWALHRAGRDGQDVGRRIVAIDIARLAALAVLAVFASVTVLVLGEGAAFSVALAWIVGIPAVALAIWLLGRRPEPVRNHLRESGDRPPGVRGTVVWVGRKLRAAALAIFNGLLLFRDLASEPHRHLRAHLGFVLFWIGNFVIVYAATRALRADVGIPGLVLSVATAHLLTLVPLPASASGGIEATLAAVLELFGAPLATALPAAFVYRAFSFWVPILLALFFLPAAKGLKEELPETERGEPPEAARERETDRSAA